MRPLIFALLPLALALPASAAYEDDGLSEAAVSTETAKNGEDEGALPVIQETGEDLAAFVTDYIRKDIQLKGSFLLESKPDGKVLKLELVSVEARAAGGENGEKMVPVVFKDAAGKKYPAFFHIQNGPWGGLDIFRIELKYKTELKEPRPPAPAKKVK
ncbi:MAG: hypothetical protein ACYC2I_00985 [Elusimicrobiales bacterium]